MSDKSNNDIFGFRDLFTYLKSGRRIFFLNFLAGISRGLGFAIGMTVIFGILIFLLRKFVSLPFLGRYIAQLLEMIEFQRQLPR